MELRKNPEADIRRKTDIYFMLGLVFALGITLGAFSYTTRDEVLNVDLGNTGTEDVEEMTDITRQEQPQTPPPPPPQTIEVMDDDSQEEESTIDDTETDQDEEIQKVQEQVDEEEKTDEPDFFVVVEDMPEFPGGEVAMSKYIQANLEYPQLAVENNIQGRVVVQFIVDERGKITNAAVVSKPLGWGCEEAALKVINSMPHWTPGKQRNKPVKVRFVVPIRFQLG